MHLSRHEFCHIMRQLIAGQDDDGPMSWMNHVRVGLRPQMRVTGAAIASFGVITPGAVFVATGSRLFRSVADLGKMTGVAVAYGTVVAHLLIPFGHWLQQPSRTWSPATGRLLTVGTETVAAGLLLGSMGLIYGWSPTQAALAGCAMLARAYPFALISKLFGDRVSVAADVRILVAWLTDANAGINTVLAVRGDVSPQAAFCEMAAFNLTMGVAFLIHDRFLRSSESVAKVG